MNITKDFLLAEIHLLELEISKAQTFLTQAQAVSSAYKNLLAKLDEPEREDNGGDIP